MPSAVPWQRFNPKLLYVDELEFVVHLLFIDVTEERHVVPFAFLYEAELDDSCTATILSAASVASGARLSGARFLVCCLCLRFSVCTALSGFPMQFFSIPA